MNMKVSEKDQKDFRMIINHLYDTGTFSQNFENDHIGRKLIKFVNYVIALETENEAQEYEIKDLKQEIYNLKERLEAYRIS